MIKGITNMNEFMKFDFCIEKIMLVCYVGKGQGEMLHKNRPSHGIALHISGTRVYNFKNGKSITINPGEIIYMPEGSDYRVESIAEGECYAINFKISQNKIFEPFKIKMKNLSSVSEHFKTARNTWDKNDYGYITKCKAELYEIIFAMQQEYFADYISNSKFEMIKPAVEYIQSRYKIEQISIAKLADICGITPEYFRQIFRSFYKTSPLKYINSLKILSAKKLIESGMYSVSEAAIQSGYTDMSHFSRAFKKETGKTPGEIRTIYL